MRSYPNATLDSARLLAMLLATLSEGGVETGTMHACRASGSLGEVNMPLRIDVDKGADVDTEEYETSDDGVDTEGVAVSSSAHELLPALGAKGTLCFRLLRKAWTLSLCCANSA